MLIKNSIYKAVITMTLGSLLLAAGGCSHTQQQEQQQAPPTVTVAPVESQNVVEYDEFTGRAEAVESVEVRPRVSGYIQEVKFQSGQLVKKGDLLFVIDPRWNQAQFDQMEASWEQAKVRADNAEREARRTEQLLASKTISPEEAESREADARATRAAVLAAQAARDLAKLDLEYTEVRAPVDGRVSRALVTAGNYVSGSAGSATLLTTLVSVDPVYVNIDMDENSLLRFNAVARQRKQAGDDGEKIPAELQLADDQGFPTKGYIESVDNHLDPNTGSAVVRAVFPNPDGRIVPGMFARLRLPLSEAHTALLVEERAIGTDQAQKFVLALSSTNTVEYRPVALGPEYQGKRIIRSGLAAGDLIIVNGLQRARPGMMVKAERETPGSGGMASIGN